MDKIKKAMGNISGFAMSVPSKAKGFVADVQRGHLLYNQGFGKYRDSSLTIAKKGKTGQERTRSNRATYTGK